MEKVLILCTGNSARSQMAEALLRHICKGKYEICSAGTEPSVVREEAIIAIEELGISMKGHRSKSVDEFSDEKFDYVLTVCNNAKETCPYFPANTRQIHHSFDDPAAAEGDFKTRLTSFQKVRDEIADYLPTFLNEIEQ